MTKIKIIKSGKIDKVGMIKIGKSLLLTLAAAAVGWLGNSVGIVDYGSYETLVATMLPFVVNALYKVLAPYESK